MDIEDSIVVGEFQRRYNSAIIQSNFVTSPDTAEIEDDLINDPSIIPLGLLDEVSLKLREISQARIKASGEVRSEIGRVWDGAFDDLGNFVAFAELINARFVKVIFGVGSSVLKAKESRPDRFMVTGAYLKCLLLLSLYGKSCSIATEIAAMLRDGYSDAATSRLRTLYEHLVMLVIISNDHTYETSERYQDHAVFEELLQLRAETRAHANPIFRCKDDCDCQELPKKLAEASRDADRARARWGPAIEEQYEWARPALATKRRQRKIVFSDLETAAGANFLRADYLKGNDRIHAGAYAAINHLDFTSEPISPTRPRRDDTTIHFVGGRTAVLIGWAARAAAKPISFETEEYDELLYACAMGRAAIEVQNAFYAVELDPAPSS